MMKKPKAYRLGDSVEVYVRIASYASAKKIANPDTYSAYCSWYA